jgi:hypothetical protein
MTDSERVEYQAKMRTLKTSKDRDAFRLDHHERMKVRAAEKGIRLTFNRAHLLKLHD